MNISREIKNKILNTKSAIDLFAGCGGLTLGLKKAGFNVIGAIENNSLAAETYEINHKDVLVWKTDIRCIPTISISKRLHIQKGELDLLAGGPPCQGFSSVRTLNNSRLIEDDRNDLIFEVMRFIEDLLPKTILIENVPGFIKDKHFIIFCNKLKELGYFFEYKILDAANYGVPQRRRRMILLGGREGYIDFAKAVQPIRTVRNAISSLPPVGKSGDPLHDLIEERSERIKSLISLIPKNGGSRLELGDTYQLNCHKKCNGFKDIYGRMSWDKVSPTITTGCYNPSKGRFLHPDENRAISLREAAILQSFPKKYYISLKKGKSAAATLIGNALPPIFVYHHAKELLKYIDKNNCVECKPINILDQ